MAKKSIKQIIGRIDPDCIIWVLESQHSISVARELISDRGEMNLILVWDPFEWWADVHGLSKIMTKKYKYDLNYVTKKSHQILAPTETFAKLLAKGIPKKIVVINPYFE